MVYNLPRDYLSYSAFSLWCKDKEAFRRKYYLNEPTFETVETIFGKEQHRILEESGTVKGSETRIQVNIDGLKLLGYLDSLCDDTLAITDFKFSHRDPKGNVPWDNLKVRKHRQLVFYSLLVLLDRGKFNPTTYLHWFETRFKKKTMEFDGHMLETKSRDLELAGNDQIFERVIEAWEVDKIKEDIIKVALEISNDYTTWQNQQKQQNTENSSGTIH